MMRVLGMKVVALLSLLQALNEELSVLGKLGKVFNISYGHMARFDQRFKVGGWAVAWGRGRRRVGARAWF